jgi:hypothetical protein
VKTFLAAIFASLWLMDAAATISFVMTLGADAESNPMMRWVIEQWGVGWFAASKAMVLAAWLCLHERAHVAVHVGLLAVMAPVVWFGSLLAWT